MQDDSDQEVEFFQNEEPQQFIELPDIHSRGLKYTKAFLVRDPQYFADFSHFPTTAEGMDQCLQTYNRLGL